MEKSSVIYFMYEEETCAKIEVVHRGITKNPLVVLENYCSEWYKLPFGLNESPSYSDYKSFLESRCFPKSRANARQLLQDAGISFYNLEAIVKKTHGVMSDDLFWIRFESEQPELWQSLNVR